MNAMYRDPGRRFDPNEEVDAAQFIAIRRAVSAELNAQGLSLSDDAFARICRQRYRQFVRPRRQVVTSGVIAAPEVIPFSEKGGLEVP